MKDNKKKNIHEVLIKIEGERWEKAIDAAFVKKQKTAKVDGFRVGKVPRNIYEKNYGKESLWVEAADQLLNEAYLEALSTSKLIPVVQPVVDLSSLEETGVEFKFSIITKPEVNVKKYKDLKVKKEEVKVSKKEVTEEIEKLVSRFAEMESVEDGVLEKGNIAIIDFEGFKDGVAFDGGKGENYSLEIGSNTFIPGFEDGLIGMKLGETKDLNLKFPEEYLSEELAGKEVVFKVKVNEIKAKVNREMDADFFEDLGMPNVNSKEDLEKEMEKNIKNYKETTAENKYVDSLLEEVSKNVEVDIPEEMVEEEIKELKNKFSHELSHQGLSLDLYFKYTNTTEKDLDNQLEKEAYKNTLYRLMLGEIKKLEKIEVSEEMVSEEIKNIASRYQITEADVEKEFGGMEAIRYNLEIEATINKLKELN